jgi:hypothetical protein
MSGTGDGYVGMAQDAAQIRCLAQSATETYSDTQEEIC